MINNLIKSFDFDCLIIPIFVGSSERNTWIKNHHDIDLFLTFPDTKTKEDMIRISKVIFEKLISFVDYWEDRHSEHQYIHIKYFNYEIDVVPCFRIKNSNKIISSVDRTPFHNIFLKKEIVGYEDEVILLKQFMKTIGVYGSEVKNKGFSGYLSELLIVKYKSFENVLVNISIFIPYTKRDIFSSELKKYNDPMVVIDPVDTNRNVAASLSIDKLCIFIDNARSFLMNPRKCFFIKKNDDISKDIVIGIIKKRKSYFFILNFLIIETKKEDTIYPQVEKMKNNIQKILEKYDFSIFGSKIIIENNECYILFEIMHLNLSNVYILNGPPVFDIKNSLEFKKKYNYKNNNLYSLYIKNGYYKVKIKRKYTNAINLLKDKILNKEISIGKTILDGYLKKNCFILHKDIKNLKSKFLYNEIYNYLTKS